MRVLIIALACLWAAASPAMAQESAVAEYEHAAADTLLMRLILAETDYETARNDAQRTDILRSWVWQNTNFALTHYQSFNVEPDWYALVASHLDASAGAHIAAHMRGEMGDMCGHLSWLLVKVYQLFGFDAGRAGWNAPSVFGHTYVLVEIERAGSTIWVVQDPTYDHTVTIDGQPADILAIMDALAAGGQGVAITPGTGRERPMLLHTSELGNVTTAPSFYQSSTADSVFGDLHVYRTAHKWSQFLAQGYAGPLVAGALGTMGAPADARMALLYFATHGPNATVWAGMMARRDAALAALP